MAVYKRGAAQLHYEVAGSGPALFLSHGYGSSSHMWRDQLEHFKDDWRVVSWDFRGHGRTLCPESEEHFSHELSIQDMLALMDELGIEKAVVGGLSLGGYMSLRFAALHPERVRALALFDTGPGYRSEKARAGWNRFAEKQALKLEERGLAALADSGEVAGAGHSSAKALALSARGILAQQDGMVMDFLPQVSVPTFVLVGGDDVDYHGSTDYMASKIPGAQKVVIPNAGHAANLDQPEAFNVALEGFLKGLSASD